MAQTRVQSAEQSTATATATVAASPIRPDRIGKQTPKCQTCCQQLGKKACGIKNYSKCVMPPCSSPPPLSSLLGPVRMVGSLNVPVSTLPKIYQ